MATEPLPQVLIVEDEPDMNNLLADVLRAFGYEPVQAGAGEEALRIIESKGWRPHAILLDLMLPDISGFEVCRRLKTSRRTRSIPLLILTALDRHVDRRHGYEVGADDYVTKPFTPEGLVSRLRKCILRCDQVRAACCRLAMTVDLTASITDLKALNLLATCLYGHTGLPTEQIEVLRKGLVRITDEAGKWAVNHAGASPVRMGMEMDGEQLRLTFEPATAGGEAFLAEHLDPEAAAPAMFTDAGVIDRILNENGRVVLEKQMPPGEELRIED